MVNWLMKWGCNHGGMNRVEWTSWTACWKTDPVVAFWTVSLSPHVSEIDMKWTEYGNKHMETIKQNMSKPYYIQSKHVFDIHRIHWIHEQAKQHQLQFHGGKTSLAMRILANHQMPQENNLGIWRLVSPNVGPISYWNSGTAK